MSERTFTKEEVSAIVQRRLKGAKESLLNTEVIIEMLRNALERIDAIEQEMKR